MSNIENQIVWSFFFNDPICANEVRELITDIKTYHKEFRTADSANKWQTIQLDKYSEVNNLKAVLLLDNYRVEPIQTNSGRWYFNVYNSGIK